MNQNNQWQCGVAAIEITPSEPIALSGWGGTRISEGTAQPIFAKALALRDASSHVGVLLTCDLLGLSREVSQALARRVAEQFGLKREQFIVNCSHNHAGPVVGDLLHTYHQLSEPQYSVIARYTDWLLERLVEVVGQALARWEPATLHWEQGLCGFAVNRRRDTMSRPASPRSLAQVVDQDVPVLAVRSANDELRAIVFGYACHPTSINQLLVSGDFPGVAQAVLQETFPGAQAMFVAGCGGDQNPLPRFGRFHEELTAMYGHILAAAVANTLDREMRLQPSRLRTAFAEIELPLETLPLREALEGELAALQSENAEFSTHTKSLEYQLARLESGQLSLKTCPFPLHVWRIGDVQLIALSGEPVVDYSLKFKRDYGPDQTWTAGYCNELTAYIPSQRVLREGAYEGKTGMLEYGWAAPFQDNIEAKITQAVAHLAASNGL